MAANVNTELKFRSKLKIVLETICSHSLLFLTLYTQCSISFFVTTRVFPAS